MSMLVWFRWGVILEAGEGSGGGVRERGDIRFRIQRLGTNEITSLETFIALLLTLQRFRWVCGSILSCHLFVSLLCSL
jgi:hypothetical protein